MTLKNHNSQRYIYLADDDSDDRALFVEALTEVDPSITIKQAQDGMYLMDDLHTISNTLPEFVFLDINMPRKSGFECLEEIRNDRGNLKELNIIVFSTSNDPATIQKAFELGATFYAVKPSTFEKLKSIIEDVLNMNSVSTIEEKRKFLLL